MTEQHRDLTLPACLIIMDGFGLADASTGNAISLANTPNLDRLFKTCPHIELDASGKPVGLPDGQMGNSEVGHLNIGAGRTVHQELSRIDNACADGSLFENPVLVDTMRSVAQHECTLHLMGLLSDGGVHSNNEHLYALLEIAKRLQVAKIRVHCFMDGRDVPPQSGIEYLEELEDKIASIFADSPDTDVAIGVISGRYYAMDRDNRWDRVEAAWRAIWLAENTTDRTPKQVMEDSYAKEITDEFVIPTNLCGDTVKPGDAFIFFNFRPDRAREITRAICDEAFDHFDRPHWEKPGFVCLTEYDPTIPAPIAFPKECPDHVLADVLAEAGLRQYHIAETEKYAHVTFFFNGGVEEPKPLETRMLIASPKVATYDLQPEMSEPKVTEALVTAIENDEADVYIVNFANCDMVGHTGVIDAAVKAVEAVDHGVGEVIAAIERKAGIALITADHGNADCMVAEDGSPFTAHTTAAVPLILVDAAGKGYTLRDTRGILANISPTLLEMIGLAVPQEMTAESLLEK